MNDGCPFCETENATVVYDKLQLPETFIVKCNQCTHIYTLQKYPQPVEKLYSTDAYEISENRQSFFDKILNREYNNIIKTINRLKPSKGDLLDFGCGKGKFAAVAKRNGWQVKAVETAEQRARYAHTVYELEVDTRFYSGGKIFTNDFDVLTLLHVVEHLQNAGSLLKDLIKHNLKKNGLVVIEVPNMQSWQSFIARNKWMHLDAARHFHHFTSKTLEQFARRLNLKTVKSSSFSFHLGVLGMTDSLLKLFGFKKNIIYELKQEKKLSLLFAIGLLLPFAWLLERMAAATGRGGIIRKYFIADN